MLVKEDGTTQVGWIQFGNSPSGSYSWDPAKVRSAIGYPYNVDVPDGKYKIRAIDYNDPRGTAVAYDLSDAPFSIVAAAFGLNDLTNQLADISQAVSKLIEKVTNLIGR